MLPRKPGIPDTPLSRPSSSLGLGPSLARGRSLAKVVPGGQNTHVRLQLPTAPGWWYTSRQTGQLYCAPGCRCYLQAYPAVATAERRPPGCGTLPFQGQIHCCHQPCPDTTHPPIWADKYMHNRYTYSTINVVSLKILITFSFL